MIIIAAKVGQLGNRLLLFAHFVAFCIEHQCSLANVAFEEYAHFFPATARGFLCRFPRRRPPIRPPRWIRRLVHSGGRRLLRAAARARLSSGLFRRIELPADNLETDTHAYSLEDPAHVAELTSARITAVGGWLFRGDALLHKHGQAVREFFTPGELCQRNVAAVIGRARAPGAVLVGLHIRRGDYCSFRGGEYFFSDEQYDRIMRRTALLLAPRPVTFLICSNEAVNPASFSSHQWLPGTGGLIEDLYALARCDFLIGPPSTFTMWASFYGKVPLYMILTPDAEPTLDGFLVQ